MQSEQHLLLCVSYCALRCSARHCGASITTPNWVTYVIRATLVAMLGYRALRCTHFGDRNLHAEIGVWIAEKCLQSCSCMCHTVQLELPHMITQMVTSISAYVIK